MKTFQEILTYLRNNFLKVILIIVLLIAFFSATIFWFKYRSMKHELNLANVSLSIANDSAKIYKNKAGELYSKIKAVEIDKRDLKASLEAMDIERKELRDKGIHWRDLATLYKAKLEASDSGSTAAIDTMIITKTDTIYGKKFNDWSNKHLFLTNLVSDNKKLDFKYRYETELFYADEKKRKETIVTIWLDDPKAVITKGSQITIKNETAWYMKPWLWGLTGLVGGYLIAK